LTKAYSVDLRAHNLNWWECAKYSPILT